VRLPAELAAAIEEALGGAAQLRAAAPVGGGCVADTARLVLSDERRFFLKYDLAGAAPAGIFTAEAESLRRLATVSGLRAPAVIDVRDAESGDAVGAGGPRWLLLEWLEPGRAAPHTWPALATSLLALHRSSGSEFGWDRDNFIGTLPQSNERVGDWPSFWRERRLRPQLRAAVDAGRIDGSEQDRFERLFDSLGERLEAGQREGPSLLHGDLWSGNLHVLSGGDPALIDPSSYYGHREVDLAMSQLFGGFDYVFYAAYHEQWPLLPGYESTRRHIYQLYYLLVHVNLFGAGYRGRTLAALGSLGY